MDSARQLSLRLARTPIRRPVVLAIRPEAVPLADELSRLLEAPLDYVGVAELHAPLDPGVRIGSAAEDGSAHLSRGTLELLRLSQEEVRQAVVQSAAKAELIAGRIRQGRPLVTVTDHTILLVDPGQVAPESVLAAARLLSRRGVTSQYFLAPAYPVGAAEILRPFLQGVISLSKLGPAKPGPAQPEVLREAPRATAIAPDPTIPTAAEKTAADILASRVPELDLGREIVFNDGLVRFPGILSVPEAARGLVLIPEISGAATSRNRALAQTLQQAGIATLLCDLLTRDEARNPRDSQDDELLAARLLLATDSVRRWTNIGPIGCCCSEYTFEAGIRAAAQLGTDLAMLIARSPRNSGPATVLPLVRSPTLLIAGERDPESLQACRQLLAILPGADLVVVPRASRRFDEAGVAEESAIQTLLWVRDHLQPAPVSTFAQPTRRAA